MLNMFSSISATLGIDLTFFALLIIFTIAVCIGSIWLLSYTMHRDDNNNGPRTVFIISLIFGIVFRFVLAALVRGHRVSYDNFIGAESDIYHLLTYGTDALYQNGVQTYPLSLYILFIFAKLGSALGFSANTVGMQIIIKLPLIICDIITAVLMYKLLSKFSLKYTAAIVSGMFMLIPFSFFSSAIWPCELSLLFPLLFLSFYFMAIKNHLGMFISFSAAMLVSKDAILLFPVFAVYVIFAFVRACQYIRINGAGGFKDIWKDENKSAIIKLPIYLISSVIVSYLITLPVMLDLTNGNIFKWFSAIYLKPIVNINVYGTDSLSIYNIFGRNNTPFNQDVAVWFVVVCALIITVLIVSMYLGKKNRANLVMIAAFVLATVYLYFIGFNTMEFAVVFPILLTAFALIKDKRILTIIFGFSFSFVLNAAGVMLCNGEFNNLLSVSALEEGAILTAINIISSIIAILTHLYTIIVTLDISSGARKLFDPVTGKNFKENFKNWLAK